MGDFQVVVLKWIFRLVFQERQIENQSLNKMTKADHIEYWKESAQRNWPSMQKSFEAGLYVESLFWAHLIIEKLLKAHWIKDNESNHPPKTHALVFIIRQTGLLTIDELRDQLKIIEGYQLETRYPDYHFKIYRLCNQSTCTEALATVKNIRLWLLSELP